MNELKIFKNDEFGEVRTLQIENETYFVGKDIAEILGYSNPQKAIRDHVDEDDVRTERFVHPLGGSQETKVINESGLYSLVISSKLPNAKIFKKWITKEVLPSIRKNGVYMTNEKAMDLVTNPTSILDLLKLATKQIEEQQVQIQVMKPKVLFADAVSTAETSILVGQLAKIIKQNGVNIGQNRMFEWLRKNGYLGKTGSNKNLPTQKAMDLGLFEIKESTFQNPDGSVRITRTTKVTGKGQQYFINKFLEI